jgi:Gene product 88
MDIRNILDFITETSKDVKGGSPFSDKLNVMTLGQFLNSAGVITPDEEEEIDEAKLDAPSRELGPEELKGYLDRIMGKTVTDPKTGEVKKTPRGTEKYVSGKTKQDKFKQPYIHRNTVVPIVDQNGNKYNLDALKSLITKRPSKILKQNEKMRHSDGTASVFYNIGLPALKGLAYDEDSDEFVIIDTCPGAGACQTYCYAMKGGYVQWKNVSKGQSQRLNFLYNDPKGFMDMLGKEIEAADKKFNKKDKQTKLVIRWHDAGDFFSPQYLAMAYALAKKYPNVDFYAYTKLASVAQGDKPKNFKMNYSMGAKPGEEKKIDFAKTKNSRVVPDALFKDLLDRDKEGKLHYIDKNAINSLKQRIAAKYSVKPDSILTYDEMMKTPPSDEQGKWNVIVKPGDGDDSANRNDVLNTFLLMH